MAINQQFGQVAEISYVHMSLRKTFTEHDQLVDFKYSEYK